MELSLESDAEALWQDTLDLLAEQDVPAALLAMLEKCAPASLDDGVLHIQTSMRMVAKSVAKNAAVIEACLEQAAFEPIRLDVQFVQGSAAASVTAAAPRSTASEATAAAASQQEAALETASTPHHQFMGAAGSTMSREEVARWNAATGSATDSVQDKSADANVESAQREREKNPLVDSSVAADSKLTFSRFVMGDENELAYNAALQVANGDTKSYNPLFIYGKSGLGKTHLLRAIQNYIVENDPDRACVYRDASQFISEYVAAMRTGEGAPEALRRNYEDIDVLIIDDVQGLAGKAGTIDFFFNVFNALTNAGKQVVIAADRTPAELGMGKDAFDERVTSRFSSGLAVSVMVPSYELKLRLIDTFCERIREDNAREHVGPELPEVGEDLQRFMAERAGSNIRTIEGFCQKCLLTASMKAKQGGQLTLEDVGAIAKEAWPESRRGLTIENVQKCIERTYDISHEDLVGPKRNKELMEPRHIAIWLCRKLCACTLADVGEKFGGRTHATVKHSLSWVDNRCKEDRIFFDQLQRIEESVTSE